MNRDIETELIKWKNNQERYPLLIRGARQVGKSYLVENFGKNNYEKTVTVNFELQPQLKQCFTNLEPTEIINTLQILLNVSIDPNNTLLFLDEIQECPQAILALRYFKEKMQNQAIIGAGSLLEFALNNEKFSMPVGRVKYLYMYPLSFKEFLMATGNKQLSNYISEVSILNGINEAIHQRLLDLAKKYFIIGGMPAVVKEYIQNNNLLHCQHLQTALLETYRSDFSKYAKNIKHVQTVFDRIPYLATQRIKYTNIDPESKSADLKAAIELLRLAGITTPVYRTSASGLPIEAQINKDKFKLNFLDTGLMQNACGLQAKIGLTQDLIQINAGAVAEQFVGQELLAYSDKYQQGKLLFWDRDKKNSSAEIDYVITVDSNICPIEVKAGKTGTLKSLYFFIEEKKLPFGIRISQETLQFNKQVLSVPLYLICEIPRLVRSI